MTRAYLAFTDTGLALARRLADALPGSVDRCGSGGVSLAGWTALQFAQSDALVFVGAVGIAVRAIAPHCRSKASDPAVVVLDECGRFAVPVLSGHLGGANDLARALAAVCGAVPVITTATDAHGIFAVDEWAKHQNCTVLAPRPPGWILHGPLPKPIFPLPSPLPGTLCIWCPASGCWASAAAGGHVPSSWKPPLLTSVPGTALPRHASRRWPAST